MWKFSMFMAIFMLISSIGMILLGQPSVWTWFGGLVAGLWIAETKNDYGRE